MCSELWLSLCSKVHKLLWLWDECHENFYEEHLHLYHVLSASRQNLSGKFWHRQNSPTTNHQSKISLVGADRDVSVVLLWADATNRTQVAMVRWQNFNHWASRKVLFFPFLPFFPGISKSYGIAKNTLLEIGHSK